MHTENNPEAPRLYLITPPQLDIDSFRHDLADALDCGDVSAVQLRLKGADNDQICRAAEAFLPICDAQSVPLLMNDHVDLAKSTGCDGVHLGQGDTAYKRARKYLGQEAVIGVTCHASRHLAMEAAEQGADYVAFGSFYPSKTKPNSPLAEIELLEWWSEMMIVPCVATGGITLENCEALIHGGADHLAAISAIWDHPTSPGAAVREFNEKIAAVFG